MKHKGFIEIDQSLHKVAELFANPDYLKEYQDGFIKKELISGEKGKVGAVSKMFYKHGKHDIELTETITKMNFHIHLKPVTTISIWTIP